MSWNPVLFTKSRKVIAANLLAFIQENMGEALTWANGTALPDFKRVYNSKVGRVATSLPCLMVARAGTRAVTVEDSTALQIIHVFGFEMKLKGNDPEEMNERADVYLTALDSVIRNIPQERIKEGIENLSGYVQIEVSDEDLDEAREGMVQMPSLIATVSLMEVGSYGD